MKTKGAFQKNTYGLMKKQVLKMCYKFVKHMHILKNNGNDNSGYVRVAELNDAFFICFSSFQIMYNEIFF